jgi:DNA polymerase III gamma/tau subunit
MTEHSINSQTSSIIDNMLKGDKIPHAIIVEGKRGNAQTELVNFITSFAVCTGTLKPCGVCEACKKLLNNNHPDVITFEGGTAKRSFSVDKIREIRQDAYIIPNEARHKVYILYNAESMGKEAQNALLKVLEEPPSYIVFILACKSHSAMLETVNSRSVVLTVTDNETADIVIKSKAEEILLAIIGENELDLLKLCYLVSLDKDKLRLVLPEMAEVLRETYSEKLQGKSASECSKTLAFKLTVPQIFALIETVDKTLAAMDSNANGTLLATNLTASLRINAGL